MAPFYNQSYFIINVSRPVLTNNPLAHESSSSLLVGGHHPAHETLIKKSIDRLCAVSVCVCGVCVCVCRVPVFGRTCGRTTRKNLQEEYILVVVYILDIIKQTRENVEWKSPCLVWGRGGGALCFEIIAACIF